MAEPTPLEQLVRDGPLADYTVCSIRQILDPTPHQWKVRLAKGHAAGPQI